VLAGLYRTAQVGVVTPLQDGMNLVAKEYVAAQNPADPGVLVLSKFAGAANELDTALLVNPHDIDGMARTIATALSMPLTERRMRWEAMMTKLRGSTIQQWFADFVDALQVSSTAGKGYDHAADRSIRRYGRFNSGALGFPIPHFARFITSANAQSLDLVTIRHAIEHGQRALFGALGLSSGTTPLPLPTNTPGPTSPTTCCR
jgi:hypothetical protein